MEGTQYLYYPADQETNSVKIMEEYNCLNGLKNGSWKQYFKLGRVKSEGNYSMGKRDGIFIYYFANGTIDSKGSFKNNLKDGNWFYYDGEKAWTMVKRFMVETTTVGQKFKFDYRKDGKIDITFVRMDWTEGGLPKYPERKIYGLLSKHNHLNNQLLYDQLFLIHAFE